MCGKLPIYIYIYVLFFLSSFPTPHLYLTFILGKKEKKRDLFEAHSF